MLKGNTLAQQTRPRHNHLHEFYLHVVELILHAETRLLLLVQDEHQAAHVSRVHLLHVLLRIHVYLNIIYPFN